MFMQVPHSAGQRMARSDSRADSLELLHCDRFREVAMLVYVTAPADGHVVRQQLQRQNFK